MSSFFQSLAYRKWIILLLNKKKKKRLLYADYLYSTSSEKSEYDRTSRSSSLYHHQEWFPFRAIKVRLKQHMYKSGLSITGM